MAQHDLSIANGSGAAVRADINAALAALASSNKGPTAPPAPTAGMLWVDDNSPSASEWTLLVYDGTDWIPLGTIDTTTDLFTPAGLSTRVATAGDTMSGDLVVEKATPAIRTNATGDTSGGVEWARNATVRWRLQAGSTAQAPLVLRAVDAAGALVGDVLSVDNASRQVSFAAIPVLPGNDPAQPNEAARKAYVDAATGAVTTSINHLRPKVAAGIGQWVLINPGPNASLVLPAGGTWAYFFITLRTDNGTYGFIQGAGVAAGGATVISGGSPYAFIGFAWRIT